MTNDEREAEAVAEPVANISEHLASDLLINMNGAEGKRCGDFDSWLEDVAKKFRDLPLPQKILTFQTLLENSTPEQRYSLVKYVAKCLHQDILTSLPPELQEHICNFIDAPSLLKACRVSKKWNLMISSLNEVWYKKCKKLGVGMLKQESGTWKGSCVSALRLLDGFRTGGVFQHQDISATCIYLEQITGLDYCDGYLIGSADDQIGIWKTDNYELVSLFQVPYRISCLRICNGNFLAIGHSTGRITTWTLNSSNGAFNASAYHEHRGHTGVVMSISVSTEIDLLASGATDFSAKVWCISSGNLIQTLVSHTHWVVQVTLVPAVGGKNSKTNLGAKHSLLTMTRDHVKVFSWTASSHDDRQYGDICEIEDNVIEFPLNSVHRFFTPGCHVTAGKVVYVKQSLVNDEEEGNAEIVFQNLLTLECCQRVRLSRKVRKLLAVGEKYALLLLPHSHYSEFNLLIVELDAGRVIGGCHLPHSSSSTPDLAQVAVGEMSWLNDLSEQKPDDLVISLGLLHGQIRVVTWKDLKNSRTG